MNVVAILCVGNGKMKTYSVLFCAYFDVLSDCPSSRFLICYVILYFLTGIVLKWAIKHITHHNKLTTRIFIWMAKYSILLQMAQCKLMSYLPAVFKTS